MPDERPFLPIGNPDEPYNIAEVVDDVDALVSDPYERAVARQIAFNVLVDFTPETRGEVSDRLASSSNQARRAYWDKAAQEIGQPTLLQMKIAAQPHVATPERDAAGRIPAICGHPGCNRFQPGDYGLQFAMVNCVKFACEEHAPLHPEWAEEWQPPIYEIGPGGGIVDVAERDRDIRQAKAEEERLRVEREAREAEAAQEIEALREFEEHRAEMDRRALRYQFPHLMEGSG